MAIQLPNPGLGDGRTGDNEYVMWTKVKDNFADQSNAASKIIGKGVGQLALNSDVNEVAFRSHRGVNLASDQSITSLAQFPDGGTNYIGSTRFTDMPFHYAYTNLITFTGYSNSKFQIFHGYQNFAKYDLYMRSGTEPNAWMKIYHDKNTTKDTATGFLKASSPVLHVYNDSITKIHEAEQLDITVDKKGVGHYEIHGTTGLRKNDGWFMSPPRDVHGNVLCMVDLEEKDGVVILKTYKKMFDFETVSIVHDWDNPMDIPEGVCVEFRFNDLPEEQLDEPTI